MELQPTRELPLERALSRVYLGIHFRYDSEAGNELGTRIGRYVLDHALRPVDGEAPLRRGFASSRRKP